MLWQCYITRQLSYKIVLKTVKIPCNCFTISRFARKMQLHPYVTKSCHKNPVMITSFFDICALSRLGFLFKTPNCTATTRFLVVFNTILYEKYYITQPCPNFSPFYGRNCPLVYHLATCLILPSTWKTSMVCNAKVKRSILFIWMYVDGNMFSSEKHFYCLTELLHPIKVISYSNSKFMNRYQIPTAGLPSINSKYH